jgi:hypothetical protein
MSCVFYPHFKILAQVRRENKSGQLSAAVRVGRTGVEHNLVGWFFVRFMVSGIPASAYLQVRVKICSRLKLFTPNYGDVVVVVVPTVNLTAGLVNPDRVNVISVSPTALAVANPVEEIVAIFVFELDQFTADVIREVTPFENVPVALNNRVAPTVKLSGEAGVIATEDNVATDKMAGWLVIPDKAAVILVFPAANPVANPVEEMEAIVLSELAQVTFEVMSAVEPSKYVPVAVK